LNAITPEGKAKLFELDVGAVFDFRTTMEIRREARLPADGDPSLGLPTLRRLKPSESSASDDFVLKDQTEFDEIKVYQNPLKDVTQYTPQETMKLMTRMGAGDDGMLEVYEEMLTDGGNSFGNIMRFILEQAKKELSEGAPKEKDPDVWQGTACIWNCHGMSHPSILNVHNVFTASPQLERTVLASVQR
jgi:hypothetical protein